MNPLIDDYPYQRWSDSFIWPGVTGSVGDVNVTPKLKTSCIELPRREERAFSGNRMCHAGTMVQNGDEGNYYHALGPVLIDSNWSGRRRKIQNGWFKMDLQSPDLMTEPFVSQLGDFSWRNKVARVFEKPVDMIPPGEFGSNGIPRGGAVPRIIDFAQEDDMYLNKSKPTL